MFYGLDNFYLNEQLELSFGQLSNGHNKISNSGFGFDTNNTSPFNLSMQQYLQRKCMITYSPSYVNTIRLKVFTRDCYLSTDLSTWLQGCRGHRKNLALLLFCDMSWLICAVRMGICNQTLFCSCISK